MNIGIRSFLVNQSPFIKYRNIDSGFESIVVANATVYNNNQSINTKVNGTISILALSTNNAQRETETGYGSLNYGSPNLWASAQGSCDSATLLNSSKQNASTTIDINVELVDRPSVDDNNSK